jgi:hypothetical protein
MIRPTDDPKTLTIRLRVSADYIAGIDAWRRKQPDVPSRSEAIRKLTAMALASKANNLQQSWRFDWEPPKAVLRDIWTIDWILGC